MPAHSSPILRYLVGSIKLKWVRAKQVICQLSYHRGRIVRRNSQTANQARAPELNDVNQLLYNNLETRSC